MAAEVQLSLLESEVTPMFVETLTGPFYDRMLNHATQVFTDMVLNGKLISTAFKSGRLEEEEYDEHRTTLTIESSHKVDGVSLEQCLTIDNILFSCCYEIMPRTNPFAFAREH
ncbi:hypothetical protein GQ457_09G018410 [Hibiscus cannabinus]